MKELMRVKGSRVQDMITGVNHQGLTLLVDTSLRVNVGWGPSVDFPTRGQLMIGLREGLWMIGGAIVRVFRINHGLIQNGMTKQVIQQMVPQEGNHWIAGQVVF